MKYKKMRDRAEKGKRQTEKREVRGSEERRR